MKVQFWQTNSGKSPVVEFLNECSKDVRLDFFDAVSWLQAGRSISMPLSRNLSSIHHGLHELRIKDRAGQFRFFIL